MKVLLPMKISQELVTHRRRIRSELNGQKSQGKSTIEIPIGSMYGMFTYMWLIFMVNGKCIGTHSIHGSYGKEWCEMELLIILKPY